LSARYHPGHEEQTNLPNLDWLEFRIDSCINPWFLFFITGLLLSLFCRIQSRSCDMPCDIIPLEVERSNCPLIPSQRFGLVPSFSHRRRQVNHS
jgi:hypothetical protein